uniref:Pentatricopeptide repeat protein n=1 Tax=Salvia miltiorrhiza TaxID=226208 RepID=A0A678WDK7_SALMI|nr:pentatricopeptide repeat protein [Salvia miltiorrhiza]
MSMESSNTSLFHTIKNCITHKKPKAAISAYIHGRGGIVIVIAAVPLVLKACASLSLLSLGKALHSEILKSGVERNVMVGTSLVDMYGKCGDIASACKVFDEMPDRNVVSWNAMIGGYMRNGDTAAASALFAAMTERTSATWNAMIDGYARNGDTAAARRVFDAVPEALRNVVTWTAMVDVYATSGDMEAARVAFEAMGTRNFYAWSVMIKGYFKRGDAVRAREVFDGMSLRNLVIWNSLISGYAQNGMFGEAMDAFTMMQEDGFEPDEVTLVSVLSACAQAGMLDVGRGIHERLLRSLIETNVFLLNALIDMYAKCGELETARGIFEKAKGRTSASWNSLITGFAVQGRCREAVELFTLMEEDTSVRPDEITFLSVLSACAHGGLVEEGLESFSKMEMYGVRRSVKHYGCLVDLLGRAGRLEDALELVKGMPVEANDTVLGALLGACRIHSDTYMAEKVVEFIAEASDHHYLLLSNIYAACERWETAESMRLAFSGTGSQKTTGCSVLVT